MYVIQADVDPDVRVKRVLKIDLEATLLIGLNLRPKLPQRRDIVLRTIHHYDTNYTAALISPPHGYLNDDSNQVSRGPLGQEIPNRHLPLRPQTHEECRIGVFGLLLIVDVEDAPVV